MLYSTGRNDTRGSIEMNTYFSEFYVPHRRIREKTRPNDKNDGGKRKERSKITSYLYRN